MKTRQHFVVPSAVVAAGLALLSGCAGESSETSAAAGEGGTSPSARPSVPPTELKKPEPRLVLTYDGGLLTLDAQTLDVIDDTPLDGFNRVNPAGDGRHVMVTAGNEFRLFDAGSWTEPHGDHSHSYSVPPGMTDTSFPSDKPGHVIHHGKSTVLFGDGDGKMQILDPEKLSETDPQPRIVEAEAPHHGAAVQLDSGELIHTVGTEEERSGVVVRDQEGREISRSEDCPGVHGEAAAKDDVIAFGCEDGILYYSQGTFTKVNSPDEYGRIGNQAGHEKSSVILGDYKVDEDAELERPERVSLTDTRTGDLKLVDLGTSYSFRSLDRGPDGEALVLGTDGQLHVIDAESGKEESVIPVVEKWTEPIEWQEARPTLYVQGTNAYVSEPAKKTLHIVDLKSGTVAKSKELPHASDEITGVTG